MRNLQFMLKRCLLLLPLLLSSGQAVAQERWLWIRYQAAPQPPVSVMGTFTSFADCEAERDKAIAEAKERFSQSEAEHLRLYALWRVEKSRVDQLIRQDRPDADLQRAERLSVVAFQRTREISGTLVMLERNTLCERR